MSLNAAEKLLELSMDDFVRLLVKQLATQEPTDPTDLKDIIDSIYDVSAAELFQWLIDCYLAVVNERYDLASIYRKLDGIYSKLAFSESLILEKEQEFFLQYPECPKQCPNLIYNDSDLPLFIDCLIKYQDLLE